MAEKYHSCHNSRKVWVNERTKYSLRCYSGVTSWLGWCLIAAQSHFFPCLWRVAPIEWAVGWESVFLEKTIPARYLGNPNLSLRDFRLILCVETPFIVFVSLGAVWGLVGSSAVVVPGVAGNSYVRGLSCARFCCTRCSPGRELANWPPCRQGGVLNPGGRGRGI